MKKIKILFLNGDSSDYLNVSILNGLLSLGNVEVYDYPEAEILYKKNRKKLQDSIRGKGFSLFFLNEEKSVKRFHLQYDMLMKGLIDIVIIGDIHNSFGQFIQYLPYLTPNNTIILDGADTVAIYPYNGNYWRKPYYWFLPKVHKKFLYFKREWTPKTLHYLWYKLIPISLTSLLPKPKNFRKISFSIPEEKIVKTLPRKTKLFPKHIVDEEVAKNIEGSAIQYAFDSEQEYYKDIQSAKFGITTKRSGWDCLRHYEIAANGTVLCFKNLIKKPITCAPHGLVPDFNCISYSSYSDLMNQINTLRKEQYSELQARTLQWVKENSCKKAATRLLTELQNPLLTDLI